MKLTKTVTHYTLTNREFTIRFSVSPNKKVSISYTNNNFVFCDDSPEYIKAVAELFLRIADVANGRLKPDEEL